MTDITIVFLILGVLVVLFVWNRLPVEIVAVGAALALAATGILTVNQAFAGFGDTTVIFIAALFVISEGIDSTGVTTWAGQRLIDHAGDNRSRLLILTLLLVAVLTAVISVNGAVAALLPMVVDPQPAWWTETSARSMRRSIETHFTLVRRSCSTSTS